MSLLLAWIVTSIYFYILLGNQSLWQDGLSYCRVNFYNLMVNPENNPAGEPGIIDANLSFWLNRSTSLLGARVRPVNFFAFDFSFGFLFENFFQGSPAFHSISELLDVGLEKASLHHDHLDDIESIFYAFCWVTIGYANLSQKVAPFPSCLNDWDDLNPKVAAYSKQATFLLDEFLPARNVSPFFGPVFEQLLRKIHGFLKPHIARKLIAANLDIVQPLLPSAIDDYATILGFFDEAIEQLRILDEEIATKALLAMLDSPITPSRPRRKRAFESDRYEEDASIGRKRPKKRASIGPASIS